MTDQSQMRSRVGLDRRMMLGGLLGVAFGRFDCCDVQAAEADDKSEIDASAAIKQLVDQAIGEGDLPGAVVCCAGPGDVHYLETFGHRWVKPEPVALTKDTIFDLASISKAVSTATSVAMLYQDKLIDADLPVKHYLPEFGGRGKDAITIKQCLLHTSGLTPDNALADYLDGPEVAWEKICGLGLRSEPGAKFAYSDVGFIVLGKLVERVSGMTLDRFATSRLFKPLAMSDTMYNPPETLRSRIAPTENQGDDWICGRVHDPRSFEMGGVAGHAGLFSSVDDLVKFGRELLAASRGESKLIRQATLDWMITPHPVPEQQSRGTRVMGWDHRSPYSRNRGEAFSERAFGHGGFTGTVLWIDPVKQLVYVFLSSRLYPDGKGAVNSLAGDIATVLGNRFG